MEKSKFNDACDEFPHDSSTGFEVSPKLDCPHICGQSVASVGGKSDADFEKFASNLKSFCAELDCLFPDQENWLCCECSKVFCSRYVCSHMNQHQTQENHPICVSFSDISFWCNLCESYIFHPLLKDWFRLLHKLKFFSSPLFYPLTEFHIPPQHFLSLEKPL
eukprot:Sdes_comp10356_c0_seq1m2000